MFRINCELRQSTFPSIGLGVFALHDIKRGEIVWVFDEGIDSKIHISLLKSLTLAQLNFLDKYAWRSGDYIYSCCDLNKFVNHSKNPNILSSKDGFDFAAKDIKAGEELFVDYSSFDDDFSSYSSKLLDSNM